MSEQIVPVAPVLLSTMIGCPRRSPSLAPTSRAIASAPPPGGNPTSSLIGFAGHLSWARESDGTAAATGARARVASSCRRRLSWVMGCTPTLVDSRKRADARSEKQGSDPPGHRGDERGRGNGEDPGPDDVA